MTLAIPDCSTLGKLNVPACQKLAVGAGKMKSEAVSAGKNGDRSVLLGLTSTAGAAFAAASGALVSGRLGASFMSTCGYRNTAKSPAPRAWEENVIARREPLNWVRGIACECHRPVSETVAWARVWIGNSGNAGEAGFAGSSAALCATPDPLNGSGGFASCLAPKAGSCLIAEMSKSIAPGLPVLLRVLLVPMPKAVTSRADSRSGGRSTVQTTLPGLGT